MKLKFIVSIGLFLLLSISVLSIYQSYSIRNEVVDKTSVVRLKMYPMLGMSAKILDEYQSLNEKVIDVLNGDVFLIEELEYQSNQFQNSVRHMAELDSLYPVDSITTQVHRLVFNVNHLIQKNEHKALGFTNPEVRVLSDEARKIMRKLEFLYQGQRVKLDDHMGDIDSISQHFSRMLLFIAVALCLSTCLFGIINFLVIRDVRILSKKAKNISQGNLDEKINVNRKDELGDLQKSIDIMRVSLKGLITTLELKVEERTENLRKKNEELSNTLVQLQHAQAKLIQSEKLASLGEMTAGIAHEINNPVNYIMSNIQPLKQGIDELTEFISRLEKSVEGVNVEWLTKLKKDLDIDYLTEELHQLCESIEKGGTRTAEIVKSLRVFSRMDAETKVMFDVEENIDATLVILKSQLSEKIEVVRNYSGLPRIEGFAGKLGQVFMNLLTNAIQAIGEEGKIIITTSSVEEFVMVSFKDSGPGIPKEVRRKIFDPFFTTKDVGEGTGLGLSISYGIIKEHVGKMDIISQEGEGAEFLIKLPKTLRCELKQD